MITDGDEQNPLNFGSNVGHKVSIVIFLENSKLYTKFLYLFTNATEPVLMIGNTGAGKSSSVNYLLGCEMKNVRGKAVPKDPTRVMAPIGMRQDSCTLYPEVYSHAESLYPLSLCDCPGFGDTRGAEEEVCASILTEMVVRNAHSVRVVVVADYNEIDVAKGFQFSELSKILNNLLCINNNLNIGFVFNKLPAWGGDVPDVLEKVNDLMQSKEKSFVEWVNRRLRSLGLESNYQWQSPVPSEIEGADLELENEKLNILPILNYIVSKPDKVHLINIFDNQPQNLNVAWHFILANTDPIDKNLFRFNGYNKNRIRFDKVLSKTIAVYLNVLKAKAALGRHTEFLRNEYDEAQKNAQYYRTQLDRNTFPAPNRRVLQRTLASIDMQINVTDTAINQHTTRIDTLNVETRELYMEERWGTEGLFALCGSHNFEYEDIPYVDSEEILGEGTYSLTKEISKEAGIYKASYTSRWFTDCGGKVSLFVKKKNLPVVVEQIREATDGLCSEAPCPR